jgi:hypothetical protein
MLPAFWQTSGLQPTRTMTSTAGRACISVVWSLTVAIVNLCPAFANAQDAATDAPPWYPSDPAFLPLRGQIFSETTIAYNTHEQDWQPNGQPVNEHYSVDSNGFFEKVQYGLTDRWSVGGSGLYSRMTEHYTYSFQPGMDVDSNRFDNPTFDLAYRAVEQIRSPVSVYVEATVTPAFISDAPRSGGIEAFVNRQLSLQTAGRDIGVTLQGEVSAQYFGAYTTNNPINGAPSDISSKWSYLLAGRSQFRLTRLLAVNAGVLYSNDSSNTVSSPDFGQRFVTAAAATVAPYVALVFDIVPTRVNLALEYDHDFIQDDDRSGPNSGTWINQSGNVYALDLYLRF